MATVPPQDFEAQADRPSAWSGALPSGTSGTRARVLDAAEDRLRRHGFSKLTMEDVARAAGVTRVTVYRHFSDRDGLLMGVLARAGQRLLARVEAAVESSADLDAWLRGAVLAMVVECRRAPLHDVLFAPDALAFTAGAVVSPGLFISIVVPILEPRVESARSAGTLREGVSAQDVAEWCVRIVMSLLILPGPNRRDEVALRAYLDKMMPALCTAGRRLRR